MAQDRIRYTNELDPRWLGPVVGSDWCCRHPDVIEPGLAVTVPGEPLEVRKDLSAALYQRWDVGTLDDQLTAATKPGSIRSLDYQVVVPGALVFGRNPVVASMAGADTVAAAHQGN